MVDKIIAGTTTDEDVLMAQSYDFDSRKKLVDRLSGALEAECADVVHLEHAMEDIANALKQARPVFAAGLPVEQALGFITKMVRESLEDLEESGAEDSDEYEKQELVLEKLDGFIAACNAAGTMQGDEAQETVHLEYRGEIGNLEARKAKVESGIANSLAFMQRAFSDSGEADAFVKALDRSLPVVRFIGLFGSPSYFAFKNVAAPGEVARRSPSDEAEGD